MKQFFPDPQRIQFATPRSKMPKMHQTPLMTFAPQKTRKEIYYTRAPKRRLVIVTTMIHDRCSWIGAAEFVVSRGLASPPVEVAVEDAEADVDVEGFREVEADDDTVVFVMLVVIDGI